jgi:hypothetical protein
MSLEWTELAYSTDWGQKSGPAFMYKFACPLLIKNVHRTNEIATLGIIFGPEKPRPPPFKLGF